MKTKWERVKLNRLKETEKEREVRLKRQRENSQRYRKRHPERVIEQRKKNKAKPDFKIKEKAYYLKNKDRIIKNSLYRKYIVRYGITRQQYEEMCKNQNYKCLICNFVKTLCVDHCHKNGKVRGLLCMNCNAGLGNLKDDVVLLNNAITYLSRFAGTTHSQEKKRAKNNSKGA